jgi:hypothetical protein
MLGSGPMPATAAAPAAPEPAAPAAAAAAPPAPPADIGLVLVGGGAMLVEPDAPRTGSGDRSVKLPGSPDGAAPTLAAPPAPLSGGGDSVDTTR